MEPAVHQIATHLLRDLPLCGKLHFPCIKGLSYQHMASYYCPHCADALGLRPPQPPQGMSTPYQEEKRAKHTAALPSSSNRVQSVFDSSATQYYDDCIQEGVARGFLAVDSSLRTQVIFCPSAQSSIGSKYKWGQFADRTDTVVVVKPFEPSKVHTFTENSVRYASMHCHHCGGPLF